MPQVNHCTSYKNVRISGLLSYITSALFKLQQDLYLTEERRFHCKLSPSNKYRRCSRSDHSGHFLICDGSPLRRISSIIIDCFRKTQPTISLESIVHMDIMAEEDRVLGLAWILGTFTEKFYSNKICSEAEILGQVKSDLSLLSQINKTHENYTHTISYIQSLLYSI